MRNAEQILAIMTATFGGELLDKAASDDFCLHKETDAEGLACRWRWLVESSKATSSQSESDQVWVSAMSLVRKAGSICNFAYADDCLVVAPGCPRAVEQHGEQLRYT